MMAERCERGMSGAILSERLTRPRLLSVRKFRMADMEWPRTASRISTLAFSDLADLFTASIISFLAEIILPNPSFARETALTAAPTPSGRTRAGLRGCLL